jgi:hypothetical protein
MKVVRSIGKIRIVRSVVPPQEALIAARDSVRGLAGGLAKVQIEDVVVGQLNPDLGNQIVS